MLFAELSGDRLDDGQKSRNIAVMYRLLLALYVLAFIFLFEEAEMFRAPAEHHVDDWNKREAEVGYAVFGAGREFGIDGLCHEAVLGHFLELYVEHPGCGFGQTLVYLARTHRLAGTQLVEDT